MTVEGIPLTKPVGWLIKTHWSSPYTSSVSRKSKVCLYRPSWPLCGVTIGILEVDGDRLAFGIFIGWIIDLHIAHFNPICMRKYSRRQNVRRDQEVYDD
jgi:hypothetical protein